MSDTAKPFILGRTEWVGLPDLGLPAIKARIDTGARTSALHAHLIEPFGPASAPMVRFTVQPLPTKPEIEIACSAPVVGRRDVTSSNGDTECRYVIRAHIAIGPREWPIEITLTNRESMTYRMLLGRQALRGDMLVEPASAFRQPRLGTRAYRALPISTPVRRALRIAILTRQPEAPSVRRLAAAAEQRGHVLERIDARALSLVFGGPLLGLSRDSEALPHFDAVIPRVGSDSGSFAAATVRQLELMGSFALNSGDALDRLANPIATVQALAAKGIGPLPGAISVRSAGPLFDGNADGGTQTKVLVVGGSAIAALEVRRGRLRDSGKSLSPAARRLAEMTASALGLGLASVDVAPAGAAASLCAVSALPPLAKFEKATGQAVAESIIAAIEQAVLQQGRRHAAAQTS